MAATLIHIKSRMLLPRPDPDAGRRAGRRRSARRAGAAAARASEVQGGGRAAARSRDAAQRAVGAARFARRGRWPATTTSPSSKSTCSACWRRSGPCSSARASGRRCRCRPSRSRSRRRIEQMLERLSETEACGFEDLFDDVATRGDMIVTFLALLEMIRLKLIRVFQSGQAGADPHLQARAAEGRAAPDSRSRGRVQGAPSRRRRAEGPDE